MVFVMAVTMFIAVIVRRRQVALGLITAFVIVSYMLQTIGTAAEDTVAESVGSVSFLTYYNAGDILSQGFIWPHIAGFVLLSGHTAGRLALSIRAARYRCLKPTAGICCVMRPRLCGGVFCAPSAIPSSLP